MAYKVTVSKTEIDEVLNRCTEVEEDGDTLYSGQTYEQGVRNGILWLLGLTGDYPFDE